MGIVNVNATLIMFLVIVHAIKMKSVLLEAIDSQNNLLEIVPKNVLQVIHQIDNPNSPQQGNLQVEVNHLALINLYTYFLTIVTSQLNHKNKKRSVNLILLSLSQDRYISLKQILIRTSLIM